MAQLNGALPAAQHSIGHVDADGPAALSSAPHRFESFHGAGRAIIRHHAGTAALSHLHFTFPLKLMSPRTASLDATRRIKRRRVQQGDQGKRGQANGDTITDEKQDAKAVAAIYIVGYGGGLVSGDSVLVDVDVGERCTALLLTQGSTKVYKMREGGTATSRERFHGQATKQCTLPRTIATRQEMRCIVQPGATAIVLPDPVTCYTRARYAQVQRFDLRCPHTSSLVLLDWFTPGRVHLEANRAQDKRIVSAHAKERWSFDCYESRNEVRLGQRMVARDVLLLEQPRAWQQAGSDDGRVTTGPSVAQRCEPYSCYASLFLFGPDVQGLIAHFAAEFHQIQQRTKSNTRTADFDNVLWSCSELDVQDSVQSEEPRKQRRLPLAMVVRIAGLTTELVRLWLRHRLTDLQDVIGDDLYKQALG